jgi:hypothetical protein
MQPATIAIPMHPKVLSNPPFTDLIISGNGITENNPYQLQPAIMQ